MLHRKTEETFTVAKHFIRHYARCVAPFLIFLDSKV